MEVIAVPIRESAIHADVTAFLLPPNCDDCVVIAVNSFDPVTRIMDLDVTLRNPTPLNGRDVRGILFVNSGHLLTNDDNWTELWDIPGGSYINPFKAFAKTEPNRVFAGEAEHMENFLVYIPVPPNYAGIKFAVDASWPGNCKEPYSLENFTQLGELYDFTGATVDLSVDVYDWQDDITFVGLVAEVINEEPLAAPFSYQAGNNWGHELFNAAAAPAGEYDLILMSSSANPDHAWIQDYVTVTISDTPAPTVEGINPNISGVDTSLTDVEITGTNFLGDCTAKLMMSGEPDIAATNVVVTDITTLVCDFDIPLGATPGLYDVEVTNGCGLSGTGTEMFEVAEQGPLFPIDVTPPWLNFAPYGICVSGTYVYVAGYMTGLHVFDITDSSDPVWVGRTDLVIVAIDANCDTYAVKKREIEDVIRDFPQYGADIVVIAIPDPHIERWALLDSSAFKKTFGKGCSAPDKKCDRDRYTNVLKNEIEKAGWSTVSYGAEHIPAIVDNMDLVRMENKRRETLSKFIDGLETRFKSWGNN